MVNRKREPWWNRKSAAAATAVSRRSKFLLGQRLSTSSVTSENVECAVDTAATACNDTSRDKSSFEDVNANCGNDSNADDVVEDGDPAKDETESCDLTPTRDEPPVWKVIDKTNDHDTSFMSDSDANENTGLVPYNDSSKDETDRSSVQQDADDTADHNSSRSNTLEGIDNVVSKANAPEYYGPPEPSPSTSSLQTWNVVSTIADDENVGSSTHATKTLIRKRKFDRRGSTESDRSTNTSNSDKGLIRDQDTVGKTSHSHKDYKQTKEYRSMKTQHKKSRSKSKDKEPESPRRPRVLSVSYDKLREKNGTALPPRTYDPLNPLGLRSTARDDFKAKPYPKRYKKSDKYDSTHRALAHSSYSSTSTEKSKRSSSEKSSESYPRSDRARSSSQDHSLSSHKSHCDKSSADVKRTGNKFFSTRISTNNSSKRHTSKYARSKSAYSVNSKRGTVTKPDNSNEPSNWMKMSTDGIGIQKIRSNQRKTFMATCVEEYSLQTNGSMAKDVTPLMAFKVGNPQFVSEFYEKKTELNDLPVGKDTQITKIMKEKFAFKVKIGFDKLDEFITEGITVSGQNMFFSQFRNPPLLSVVYGRSKTYNHLGEAIFIKEDHRCDCLKASLSGMRRKDSEFNEIRKGLACSKVILADFDPIDGTFRDRPRQILPYAIVMYARTSHTESEQADLKQRVLEWKRDFEMERWKIAAAEHSLKQQTMQQQAQLAMNTNLMMPDNHQAPQQPWPGMMPNSVFMPPPMENPNMMTQINSNMMAPFIEDHCMLSADYQGFEPEHQGYNFASPMAEGYSSSIEREENSNRKHRRSRSISSVDSMDRASSKNSKDDRSINPDLDRQVSEALSFHRRALEMKDVGVQVKTQSIISLQKKNVSLSASTQTPDLDKDDSYEASLLRGGPLVPPTVVCARCNDKVDKERGAHVVSTAFEKLKADRSKTVARLFVNQNSRPRKFASLSERFGDGGTTDDGTIDHKDDMLLDEDL